MHQKSNVGFLKFPFLLHSEAMNRNNISVRLLLSVDRARGVEDAWSTLRLAKEYLAHVRGINIFFSCHSVIHWLDSLILVSELRLRLTFCEERLV